LLWNAGVEREDWVGWLVDRTGYEYCRAEELLLGGVPHSEEIERVATVFGVSREDVAEVDLVGRAGVNVLLQNLCRLIDSMYLINSKGRGAKKPLADHLGVHPTTVSKWYSGEQDPTREHLKALHRYFGLSGIELRTDPIFLSPVPIGKAEQKAWLREQIDRIDDAELGQLYPVLQRLLGGR
jgi:transcriptional regulator with XRE-family HTH domain